MEVPPCFSDRRLIVALSGGIACYKSAMLVSRLVQHGADVTVVMTRGAMEFVRPLTFESLSGKAVLTDLWQQVDHHDSQHVALARGADLMIIAPATANTLAKLATGICDNLLTTLACAMPRTTPVLIAPAMNAEMWDNPVTQRNMATIRQTLGYHVQGPTEGWQACRTRGPGRMSEPDVIFDAAKELLQIR